ncbi:hypothetical protein PSPO01_03248 [Paraphaeosphaeria sporulosa]
MTKSCMILFSTGTRGLRINRMMLSYHPSLFSFIFQIIAILPCTKNRHLATAHLILTVYNICKLPHVTLTEARHQQTMCYSSADINAPLPTPMSIPSSRLAYPPFAPITVYFCNIQPKATQHFPIRADFPSEPRGNTTGNPEPPS